MLGAESSGTSHAVHKLGTLLKAQGKLAEAEPFYRRTLEAQQQTLGADHAGTLTAVSNLTIVLKGQGKLADAEPM